MPNYKPSKDSVSLLNFLERNESLKSKIRALTPEQLEASENTLETICNPTTNDRCLKISFWQEYKRAQNEERFMLVSNIYHDIYTQRGWLKKISNPDFFAWLIHPPQNEYLLQLHLIDLGMKKLTEVMNMELTEKIPIKAGKDKHGNEKFVTKEKVNVPLIKEIRGIVEMLQNRAYGSVLHRQANVNYDVGSQQKTISIENIDEIEEKINKLKRVKQLAIELTPDDEGIIDVEDSDKSDT